FRLGCEVRQSGKTASHGGLRRSKSILSEQRSQGRDSDAGAGAGEEVAPGDVHIYSLVMVSSRLRMVPATVVQAANSVSSTLPGLEAPTAMSFAAAAGSFL